MRLRGAGKPLLTQKPGLDRKLKTTHYDQVLNDNHLKALFSVTRPYWKDQYAACLPAGRLSASALKRGISKQRKLY
jgi:hypothetical protein